MKELTSSGQLSKIVLKGFKSIEECELKLGSLNVLIGCNGAGKSNFISFFRMIQQVLKRNLQLYISRQGGPDAILHFGRKITKNLSVKLFFDGNNGYEFVLEPTQDNRMMFSSEKLLWNIQDHDIGLGHFESRADEQKGRTGVYDYVIPMMRDWMVYHFHDTGIDSPIKRQHDINDNAMFSFNGSNLAAYLFFLKDVHPNHYYKIVKMIGIVVPFFGDFNLRPNPLNPDKIELEWVEKGQETPFKAHHLSDGTLRFICLATVLLQPVEKQPKTILVDEPELGLHPYAIKVLAGLMRSVSKERQLIVSTQSINLLNEFDCEDVVVVNREDGKSSLRRLNEDELEEWLKEYTLGELWQKNILGGRPAR